MVDEEVNCGHNNSGVARKVLNTSTAKELSENIASHEGGWSIFAAA